MVLCSHSQIHREIDSHQTHNAKMASQLESCLSRQVYSGLKSQEDPAVHCLADADCSWVGSYEEILLHCKQCHPNAVWWTGDKERSFTVKDITKDSYQVELVVAYGHLFWLHVKNDLKTGHLYAACQHIVMKNEDPHTKFMIRTELCDASRMNCISCSTETRPHTEDITKIFTNQHCAVRSHHRLTNFIDTNSSLSFSVHISKMYYFQ